MKTARNLFLALLAGAALLAPAAQAKTIFERFAPPLIVPVPVPLPAVRVEERHEPRWIEERRYYRDDWHRPPPPPPRYYEYRYEERHRHFHDDDDWHRGPRHWR